MADPCHRICFGPSVSHCLSPSSLQWASIAHRSSSSSTEYHQEPTKAFKKQGSRFLFSQTVFCPPSLLFFNWRIVVPSSESKSSSSSPSRTNTQQPTSELNSPNLATNLNTNQPAIKPSGVNQRKWMRKRKALDCTRLHSQGEVNWNEIGNWRVRWRWKRNGRGKGREGRIGGFSK